MKILRHFQIVISGVFLCIYNLNAQTDPREILNKVQAQYEAIEDYQVSVHLNVDIQNFRMPNKNMRVYFKKPDKLKVKTSGFAIVPRFGLLPTPETILKDSVRLEYVRSLREKEVFYHVVSVHPLTETDKSPDIFLRINADRWTIDRAQMEFPKEGVSVMDIVYQNVAGFWLPETTSIVFDLKHAIPPVERPNIERPFGGMEQYAGNDSQPVKGSVKITFTDFIINRGIKDAVFEEEDY